MFLVCVLCALPPILQPDSLFAMDVTLRFKIVGEKSNLRPLKTHTNIDKG